MMAAWTSKHTSIKDVKRTPQEMNSDIGSLSAYLLSWLAATFQQSEQIIINPVPQFLF